MYCLPQDGGLFDQDWKFVNQLAVVMELDQKRMEKDEAEAELKSRRQTR